MILGMTFFHWDDLIVEPLLVIRLSDVIKSLTFRKKLERVCQFSF